MRQLHYPILLLVLFLLSACASPKYSSQSYYISPTKQAGKKCIEVATKKKKHCDNVHSQNYQVCVNQAREAAVTPFNDAQQQYERNLTEYDVCLKQQDAERKKQELNRQKEEQSAWVKKNEASNPFEYASTYTPPTPRTYATSSVPVCQPPVRPNFDNFVETSSCPKNTCLDDFQYDYRQCGGDVKKEKICIANCPDTKIEDIPAPLVVGTSTTPAVNARRELQQGWFFHFENSRKGPYSVIITSVDEDHVFTENTFGENYLADRNMLFPRYLRSRDGESRIWREEYTLQEADSWFPLEVGKKVRTTYTRDKRTITSSCEVLANEIIMTGAGKVDAFKVLCQEKYKPLKGEPPARFHLLYYSDHLSTVVYQARGAVHGGFEIEELVGLEL